MFNKVAEYHRNPWPSIDRNMYPGIELIKFKTGEKVDYDEDISCLSDVEIFKINEFTK